MSTDELDVAAIRARAEAATSGPWKHNGVNGVHTLIGACVATTQIHEDQRRWEDAAFIAHARTDIPALLAEVARLRAGIVYIVDRYGNAPGIETCATMYDLRRLVEATP